LVEQVKGGMHPQLSLKGKCICVQVLIPHEKTTSEVDMVEIRLNWFLQGLGRFTGSGNRRDASVDVGLLQV